MKTQLNTGDMNYTMTTGIYQ